jgi:hypothetical protein
MASTIVWIILGVLGGLIAIVLVQKVLRPWIQSLFVKPQIPDFKSPVFTHSQKENKVNPVESSPVKFASSFRDPSPPRKEAYQSKRDLPPQSLFELSKKVTNPKAASLLEGCRRRCTYQGQCSYNPNIPLQAGELNFKMTRFKASEIVHRLYPDINTQLIPTECLVKMANQV